MKQQKKKTPRAQPAGRLMRERQVLGLRFWQLLLLAEIHLRFNKNIYHPFKRTGLRAHRHTGGNGAVTAH